MGHGPPPSPIGLVLPWIAMMWLIPDRPIEHAWHGAGGGPKPWRGSLRDHGSIPIRRDPLSVDFSRAQSRAVSRTARTSTGFVASVEFTPRQLHVDHADEIAALIGRQQGPFGQNPLVTGLNMNPRVRTRQAARPERVPAKSPLGHGRVGLRRAHGRGTAPCLLAAISGTNTQRFSSGFPKKRSVG